MGKIRKISIVTIVIIYITVSGWWILTPKILSNKVANRYGVFIPKGIADEYLCGFDYTYWRYELDSDEQKQINGYINEYTDIWYELSDETLAQITESCPESYKFDLSNIYAEDSYYCFLSTIHNKYMHIKDGKDTITHSVIIIWDRRNSEYHYIHQSVR